MTKNIIKLKVGDLKGNTNKSVYLYFDDCTSEKIPITESNTEYTIPIPSGKRLEMFNGLNEITETVISAKFAKSYFVNIGLCVNVYLDDCDISAMDSMRSLFLDNRLLKTVDFGNINTENISSMDCMFYNCYMLHDKLDLSHFNTANVENMKDMFTSCRSLRKLDLSTFDTQNLGKMDNMFQFCENLESLDLSGWDLPKITSNKPNWMFYGTTNLKTVYMRGCNEDTIKKIRFQLDDAKNFGTKIITE